MAKPPAEVSFPGDKNRRKKVRVRGIKQASKQIQARLDRNLDRLLEDPAVFLPEIRATLGKPRRDFMAATIKEVDYVATKRHDRRWLSKRMVKRRGDAVCRALAGSLLAALEEDHSTVSVFKNPIYGSSSFLRRGNGKQSHMVGIQNHDNSKLRLLVFDEHAKQGLWFFSWDGGFVYTGNTPDAPDEWVTSVLDSSSIPLSGKEVRWSRGLDESTVKEDVHNEAGWLKLEFQNGTTIGLSAPALAKSEEAFVPSVALNMIPPKLSEIVSAEWMWRPEGWPEGRELPIEGQEKLDDVLLAWMSMAVEDGGIARNCRAAILNSIEDGYIAGSHWFDSEEREDFLQYLSGTEDERAAIAVVLDSLDEGIHVRVDGHIIKLETDVFRFEERACHPILVSLWEDYGHIILEEMFGIEGEDAERIHAKQAQRKQGFAAFLRELDADLANARKMDRLPWKNSELPAPLNFIDKLVRKAVENGIASTVSEARKGKGLDAAMGWAWLVVHQRTESDAWRFDGASRDKGGDWVPAVRQIWQAAERLLVEGEDEGVADYVEGMRMLASISGTSGLPDL